MKVLFITRSYSKNKGGKEIYNYNLINSLKKKSEVKLVSSFGNILNMVWFYPYSFLKGFFILSREKVGVIHSGDNFVLPVSLLLSRIFGKKTSLTIYGLELTYSSKVYRTLFLNMIKKVDYLIAISEATKKEAVRNGIDKNKIKVIVCGINPGEFKINISKKEARKILEKKLEIKISDKKMIFTNGRLVKRKGVEWFVSEVMPKIPENYIYLISGEGKEKRNIENSIKRNNLKDRVFILNRTDFETLKLLYNSSDVFVMPNIKVKGDMEGFGIVLIEAGSVGTPVIGSNIEGIKDAVIEGKTGFLVKEKSYIDFIKAINLVDKLKPEKIQKIVEDNYSWNKIAKEYLEVWE